jgi:hypothetical protein
VHASPHWTDKRIEDESEVISAELTDAFWKATGLEPVPVRFAAGEWYVLGISHKSHAEAQEDYSNRQLRNSERQRGKRRGSKNHNSTPILCVDTGIIYESQGMAADATGAHQSKISECCSGNRKSAGGYRWSFVS